MASTKFTVQIEPDAAKLDAVYTNYDGPLSFEESEFPKDSSRKAKDISNTKCRKLFQKFMTGDNFFLEVNLSASVGVENVAMQFRLEEDDRWRRDHT